jgi:hypothetical protein
MKNAFLLLLTVLSVQSYSQQKHFSLSMALRMQSDSIFCDLIAKDDYSIVGFQFGFHHNSDQVEFLEVQQKSLPGIGKLDFNEICPKYVRMLWNDPKAHNYNIRKGDVLFTLVYKELQPTDHFICMMASKGDPGGFCSNFPREAFEFDLLNGNLIDYIVDDICVNYEISNGQPILLSSDNEDKDQIQVFMNDADKNLIIGCDPGISTKNMKLQITSLNGADCIAKSLETKEYQQVDLSRLPAGLYYYNIVSEKRSLSSGKIVLR